MVSEIKSSQKFERYFTKENLHPYDEVEWGLYDAVVKDYKSGEVKFEQKNVEFPSFYSQSAINIIASKYFKGQLGTENREWKHVSALEKEPSIDREWSYKQLIDRVVFRNIEWGRDQGYFETDRDAIVFSEELTYILLHQMAYFNSPVWFNMGFPNRPQTSSACFINSVDDTMESILELSMAEGLIFRAGSGSGVNISPVRSKHEGLSTGGVSSGVLSFMKVWDSNAGAIKSGGATRRAACMRIMDIDHPEIIDFIQCKVKEEEKALALIREGFDSSFNGEAYSTITFQNANNSVRVNNEFMSAVENDEEFWTRFVVNGKKHKKMNAKMVFKGIAEAAWKSGDPGLQFADTINKWNTVKNTNEIKASNPCSEFLFVDNTSCNLASINLIKFLSKDWTFLVNDFVRVCQIMATAMDIWIDRSDYPIEKISTETKKFRTIGLGYANLGALIMGLGLAYDSDEARTVAAAITSLMTAAAYEISAKNCEHMPTFPKFEENKSSMLSVLKAHLEEHKKIKSIQFIKEACKQAKELWNKAIEQGTQFGFRNAYVSNIAPTGTIGLAMDCDTTGCEPELAHVKYKKLAGSDVSIKIINNSIGLALNRLGYNEDDIEAIKSYILSRNTVEDCPQIKPEHVSIFDTSFTAGGIRFISFMGHIKMLSAIQPFLSGGISKTINMPENATIDDIMEAYMQAWKLGVKCITIYRDNSKGSQPLSVIKNERTRATRVKLPDDVDSKKHKFQINGYDVVLHTGCYDDGTLGEIYVRMGKTGSTMQGIMDTFAIETSMMLQYGVPLKKIVEKLLYTKFEPHGFTSNKEIPMASSIVDYIMRYLAMKYMSDDDRKSLGINGVSEKKKELESQSEIEEKVHPKKKIKTNKDTSALCSECGGITETNGNCRFCPNCGSTSGCS